MNVSPFRETVISLCPPRYELQSSARTLALPYLYFCRFTVDAVRPAELDQHNNKTAPAPIIMLSQADCKQNVSCLEQYRVSNVHKNELNIPLGDLPSIARRYCMSISTILPLLHLPEYPSTDLPVLSTGHSETH